MCRYTIAAILPLFLVGAANGQTGPGGVGNSTSNVLWLSADYGVYNDAGTTPASNGNNVRQWNDRSGNNKNAGESNSANRPNYITGQLNGLPVIRFTAANADKLLSSGVSTGNSASVWVVARYSSLPSDNPGLAQGSPAGESFSTGANRKIIGMWVDDVSRQAWGRGVESGGTQRDIPRVTALTSGSTYVINNIYSGSMNSINQYISGAAGGSVFYNGTLGDWSEFGIGRQGSESWNGDIAEVIVFNTAVNTAQRIIIDNYLAAKYGFTLASNDLYDEDNGVNGNYDFDVAGIGRATVAQQHVDAKSSIVRINDPSGLGTNSEYYIWGHDNGGMVATTSGIPGTITERLERIWRGSETGDVGSVDVSFDMTGFGPFAATDLRLLISNNDADFSDGTDIVISGAIDDGGNIFRFANVTQINNNSRFTIGVASGMLPVELLEFKAQEEDGAVLLSWSTASELNNDHFTVERSIDGRNFELVAKTTGAGTINQRNDYTLTDPSPYAGRSYYRLSQTDFDGTTEYFPLVSVDLGVREADFGVYPNPSPNGEFNLEMNNLAEGEPVAVRVFDLQGVQVIPTASPGYDDKASTIFRFTPQRKLEPGIYLVKISYAGKVFTEKLVIR